MKKILVTINLILCAKVLFAQTQDHVLPDTSFRSMNLGEVVVKGREPDKFSNRIHSDNVFIVLNPTTPGVTGAMMDSTYFVTRFQQPEKSPILLNTVELKLKHYDTAMFDMKLIIFQVQSADTLRKVLQIDPSMIDKKGKLQVLLFDENITLQSGDFYIGFGFHTKNIPKLLEYRMYATNKGEGAMITFKFGGTDIVSNPHFPYVFPFKISYRKL